MKMGAANVARIHAPDSQTAIAKAIEEAGITNRQLQQKLAARREGARQTAQSIDDTERAVIRMRVAVSRSPQHRKAHVRL